MSLILLYQPHSDHHRDVEDYADQLNRENAAKPELVSIGSRQGQRLSELYGPLKLPAVLILKTDGQLLYSWQGQPLPLRRDVQYYARRS